MSFNLYDRVTSKFTGLPACGHIVGISDPAFYCGMSRRSPESITRWNELFQDWTEKSIYYVRLDSPQKPLSFEEYCKGSDKPKAELKILYDNTVPEVIYAAYPEDDLEKL